MTPSVEKSDDVVAAAGEAPRDLGCRYSRGRVSVGIKIQCQLHQSEAACNAVAFSDAEEVVEGCIELLGALPLLLLF